MTAASSATAAGLPVSLADITITQELSTRPFRSQSRKGEAAALYCLATARRQDEAGLLRRLATLAIELCDAGTGGVSVIEDGDTGTLFRWRALAGDLEQYEGGTTPRDWSPCGECLKADHAVLYSYPARYFTYFQQIDVPIVEGLVIPMYADGVPIATIWVVSHTPAQRFNAEHVRIMTSLGAFAASALQRNDNSGEPRSTTSTMLYEDARPDGAFLAERELVWEEYLRRIARHDELALEMLAAETHALVFSTALRIVSFRADADEITADVYAQVWLAAGTFNLERGSVSSWLTGIAKNSAIDRLRARTVRQRSEAALSRECHHELDPLATIDASRATAQMHRALQALPADQRRAIELYYLTELSLPAIAAQLGHPLGTIKTRLRLGLMKLRRLLAALEIARPRHRAG